MAENTYYDPKKSRVSEGALTKWLTSPISGVITEVPGVGEAAVAKFAAAGITTTFELLGKYLMLKGQDVESVELAERFWGWLKSIDAPAGYRAGIVLSVGEKLNITFPGIYDANEYPDK